MDDRAGRRSAAKLDCDRYSRCFGGSRRTRADGSFGCDYPVAKDEFLRVANSPERVAPTLREETLGGLARRPWGRRRIRFDLAAVRISMPSRPYLTARQARG